MLLQLYLSIFLYPIMYNCVASTTVNRQVLHVHSCTHCRASDNRSGGLARPFQHCRRQLVGHNLRCETRQVERRFADRGDIYAAFIRSLLLARVGYRPVTNFSAGLTFTKPDQ